MKTRHGRRYPSVPARFDDILARLRSLVERLEGGNLPLEDGLRYFEEGMELCRQGAAVLDKAEKRVEVLLADGRRRDHRTPRRARRRPETAA